MRPYVPVNPNCSRGALHAPVWGAPRVPDAHPLRSRGLPEMWLMTSPKGQGTGVRAV